jgi:hypothetical protein
LQGQGRKRRRVEVGMGRGMPTNAGKGREMRRDGGDLRYMNGEGF